MTAPFPALRVAPAHPAFGLIVLQQDERIEPDFRRLLPEDARLHVSRIPSGAAVTTDTLAGMETHLTAAAALLPPAVAFDAVGYGCTSGAAVIGRARVAELVRGGATAAAVSEPASALIAAARALGITRFALLSPYVAEVSDRLRTVLAEDGIGTPRFGSFEIVEEAEVARIAPTSIAAAAIELGRDASVEGVILSCTNLNGLAVIGEVEAALGKPVISSNSALAWDLCRAAGVRLAPGAGAGRLGRV